MDKKTLYTTDNEQYEIWVEVINEMLFSLFITDSVNHVTYEIADFDGTKYHIKNKKHFDNDFVYYCKRNPEIIDNLMKFIFEKRKYYDEINYI